ncbi:acyl-CoA dehydrogenase family protein [Caulobacter mirabilis]|uniref:Pimeloyl-CoA dehydrogenase large subunit n=1 Tax=Caulobacter mirabilis TaxID=69666 RepID=A0A2D2AWB9_9CAUL|nr:acyl-CoA dehydrogenase family protein [Caulobacter mirabilis]ATQ42293.1 pimeloyl-CoA dehydrogenase large subunit [Caulobacter mirabilis]
MDLAFSEEDKAFQREVRDWIAEHYDADLRKQMSQSKNGYLDKAGQVKWQKLLAARGWAAPNWPVEHGGPGFTSSQAYIYNMEMSLAGAPRSSPMGLTMVAPVIMAFGSDEQKKQHLPPILQSDIWWCQGYSEPGSGSDLASLSMKAERDGDDYVLNGSKIWTTHAQWADWMFCLVRTDASGKPQQGISFLLLRMDTPGVSVKPLPTLDGPADGQQEINQVFFDNVRVPVSNRIGEEGKGWTYAKYLLEFERGNAFAPALMHALKKVRTIASAEFGDGGEPLIGDRDFQRKLAEMEIQVATLNATELRIFSAMGSGEPVGPASSMLKCAGSETQQAITELALEAVGNYAAPFVQDTWSATNEPRPGPDHAGPAAPAYFNYRKASIYAGSNEIQRNIMAKLVLGL